MALKDIKPTGQKDTAAGLEMALQKRAEPIQIL